MKIECSHFEPLDSQRPADQLPCVIYLHGNSSSRLEALGCVAFVLPMNMTLFCFDFSGSGLSEGEYISLGFYEREDLKTVIAYLRDSGRVSTIGLWGRSMGAVTALLHADRDPSIAGLVLDSGFTSLAVLSKELFRKYSKKMPGFFFTIAFKFVKSTVKKKAKFNLADIEPIKHVNKSFVPAFFVTGKEDDFIDPHHSRELHAKYQGEKNLIECDGDHNSPRPDYVLTSAAIFLHNATLAATIPEVLPKGDDAKITRSFPKWTSFYEGYDPSLFDPAPFDPLLLEEAKFASLSSQASKPPSTEKSGDKTEEKENEEGPGGKEKSTGSGKNDFPVVGASPYLGAQFIDDEEEEQKLVAMLAQLSFQKHQFSFNQAVDEVLELMEKRGDDKEKLREEVEAKLE